MPSLSSLRNAPLQGRVSYEPSEPLVLDVQSRELCGGDRCIALQSQSFEILRALVERAGEVVERDELCRRLWPEDTFVDFEHGLNAAIRRLRRALGDAAHSPRFIETIPRVGYRFLGGAEFGHRGGNGARSRRIRLAVLPMYEIGDTNGFADGFTEELFAQVGTAVGDRVALVARSTSMLFKGVLRRPSEIGRFLNADYLLEGTVRSSAGRVRVTASVVETSGETHLWNDTFDLDSDGPPFSAQADGARRIAAGVARFLMNIASSQHG